MAVRYCPVCGKELEENAVKCKLCGAGFGTAEAERPRAEGAVYGAPVPPAGVPYGQQYQQYAAGPVPPYAPQYGGQYAVYGAYPAEPVYPPASVNKPGRGAGIAALVLGIIAILAAFILLFDGIGFFEAFNNTLVSDDSVGYGFDGTMTSYEYYLSEKNDIYSGAAITVIFSVLAFSLGLVGRKHASGVTGTVLGGLSLAGVVFAVVLALTASVMIL